ncbi:MAG: ABC transporter permease [Bacteroidia bacterium]|nr:ABC transporter permease [Bacteroidia bacterium]
MNFAWYLARKFTFSVSRVHTRLIIALAIGSAMLAIAVMEVSISVVFAFESAIKEKIIGFTAHAQLTNYLPQADNNIIPITLSDSLLQLYKGSYVRSLQPFIYKTGILKSKNGLEGIQVKGVTAQWDSLFFKNTLVAGRLPDFSSEKYFEVLLSQKSATKLGVQVGEKVRLYFLEKNIRARPIIVSGIYETGLAEFDARIAIGSLTMLQQILGWEANQVEGLDIFLHKTENLPLFLSNISSKIAFDQQILSVYERYPEIFDWLNLQHQNVLFILILMILIAMINLSAALVVLILERTSVIGLLKAMGASLFQLYQLFLGQAFWLICIGIVLGNALGLGLLWVQQETGFIAVDPDSYFVEVIPVSWRWVEFGLINLGTLIICLFSMLIPVTLVSRIQIIQAMRLN